MEILRAFGVGSAIVLFLALAELLRRRLRIDPELTRKFVHLATGALVFFAPKIFHTATAPIAIASSFVVLLVLALRRNWLPGVHGAGEGRYGTLYFALAFLLLTIFCWEAQLAVLMAGMQVLTWGDGLAAIVGGRWGRHPFRVLKGRKTVEGTLTMLGASFLAMLGTLLYFHAAPPGLILWIALVVALLATGIELATPAGLDNLTIALGASFFTYFMLHAAPAENVLFSLGVLMSGLVAIVAYRTRALDLSGAFAAVLLGAVIFGIGGWRWTLPILVFFVSSTVIGRVGHEKRTDLGEVTAKEGARDVYQSMANGGLAMAIIILSYFYRDHRWYYVFLGSLAAVTADTWSSEIGVLSKRPPVSMTTWKPVPRGLSGGVTRLGFLAGLVGSLLVVSTGLIFDSQLVPGNQLFLVILLAGFFGTMADSFLGATVQGIFRCPSCHVLTERRVHCAGSETVLHSGSRFVNNDLVNVVCGLSGGLFVLVALALVR
jgi:uncharacterized protein (TIGR00297 family)